MYTENEVKGILLNWHYIRNSTKIDDKYICSMDVETAVKTLNEEQQHMAHLIALQMTNNEIAIVLECSERTIKRKKKTLLTNICNYLNGTK